MREQIVYTSICVSLQEQGYHGHVWTCCFNTLNKVSNDVILWKGTDCTFNKQSGNFLVTSSSSTAWNDTVRGADVGLVTERIKVTSSYSGERHT